MSRAARLALVAAFVCPYVLLLLLWWRMECLRKEMVSARISYGQHHRLWATTAMRNRADRAFAAVSGVPLAEVRKKVTDISSRSEEGTSVVSMQKEWSYGTERPLTKEQVSDLKAKLEAAISPQLYFDAGFSSSRDEGGNEIWESWHPWTDSPHWYVTSKISVNTTEKGTGCKLFVHAWFK